MARESNKQHERKPHLRHRVKKSDFRHHLFIESYGVKIRVTSNAADGIEDARKIIKDSLPKCFQEIEETEVEHDFLLVRNPSKNDSLYKNGESVLTRINREGLITTLGSKIRLTMAEYAVRHVFVHAGVVSWKGKSLIVPGTSLSGKTTLTAELVKRGALYYSDDFAVFDSDGLVHPFAKPLSIRDGGKDFTQIEYSVEEIGGIAGEEKIRPLMILITEFKPKAKWNPRVLSKGKGIMELLKHTIPMRRNPVFTLEVLNKIVNQAVMIKTRRNDVSESADKVIDYLENVCC